MGGMIHTEVIGGEKIIMIYLEFRVTVVFHIIFYGVVTRLLCNGAGYLSWAETSKAIYS